MLADGHVAQMFPQFVGAAQSLSRTLQQQTPSILNLIGCNDSPSPSTCYPLPKGKLLPLQPHTSR
jgi:hypothetical protein